MNWEKVIKGLEICTTRPCYCKDCPYEKTCALDSQELMEDVLALMKEQEKKEIKLERYVPIELFLEVLEKYKESESSRIWERSTHIREDLKELDEEISKYKNCCF